MSDKVLKITPVITLVYGILLAVSFVEVFGVSTSEIYIINGIVYTIPSYGILSIVNLIVVSITLIGTIILVTLDIKNAKLDQSNESLSSVIMVIKALLVLYGLVYLVIYAFQLIFLGNFIMLEIFSMGTLGTSPNSIFGIYDSGDILFTFVMVIYCVVYAIFTLSFVINLLRKYNM